MLAMRRGCSPAVIARELSSRDITEMLQYFQLDPLGVEWRQSGLICATIANSQRSEGEPFKEEQFIACPRDEDEPEEPDESAPVLFEQSPEELRAAHAAFGIPL